MAEYADVQAARAVIFVPFLEDFFSIRGTRGIRTSG